MAFIQHLLYYIHIIETNTVEGWERRLDRTNVQVVCRACHEAAHVLPVVKGGTHTWDNVQLAHRGCNSSKDDNPIHERQGQLVLSV